MNEYRVTVSFGDGNPTTTTIKAKSGADAQDIAFKQHPAARVVHVLGFVSNQQTQSNPCLVVDKVYGCDFMRLPSKKQKLIPVFLDNNEINPILIEAVKLKKDGLSQQQIANTLGISRGVVRRLLNASLDLPHTNND